MNDEKRPREYPFQEYAWDDDPDNDNTWVDGKEAKQAYEAQAAEIERLKRKLADAAIVAGKWGAKAGEATNKLAQCKEALERAKLHLSILIENAECRGDEDCDHCVAVQEYEKLNAPESAEG